MRRLIPVLIRWFSDPVIRVTPSDEVIGLRVEVQRLKEENTRLIAELKRVEALYYEECLVNMRLSDENRFLTDYKK